MVDCRAAGASPHDAPNDGSPTENHHIAGTGAAGGGGGGDMAGLAGSQAAAVRASTPATNAVATYTGGMSPAGGAMLSYNACAPYCGVGVKGVVWCAPQSPPPLPPHAPPTHVHHHPAPPLPMHTVNAHVLKSVQANGADLPMNDITTLRYFFNLGVDCMWSCYGPPPYTHLRQYAPRDITQEMGNMSLQERPGAGPGEAGPKPRAQPERPPLGQGKGAGQRPLVGPRFKRNNGHDGNQNNGNGHKGHGGMSNRNMNGRRNSYPDGRAHGYACPPGPACPPAAPEECPVEPPIMSMPYVYPPPIYSVPYYPIEHDPAMMGMMNGIPYVEYGESVEYPPMAHYYPPPPHYAPLAPPPPAHAAHPAHAAPDRK